ncbi:hypothetical protein ACGF12_11840 [Kitasatospora sp. NPDC048296]
MATKQYLKEKCPPEVGAFTGFGSIEIVREVVDLCPAAAIVLSAGRRP